MKSYTVVPLLVAAATAQINGDFGPNCGIENIPVSDLLPQVQVIGQALVDINTTTAALNDSINAFVPTDINTVIALQTASTNVLNQIESSDDAVAAIPALTNSDEDLAAALDLPRFVSSLACNVNRTVANLISHKQDYIDACIAPLVLSSIQQQQNVSDAFSATVLTKLPSDLAEEGERQTQPLKDALSSAVAAFASETTTPPSCAPGGGSTSTTTTTSTSTGGGVYPTGGYPTNPYPTEQPYPTGGDDDDCDDEPSGSYPPEYPTAHPTYTTTKSYGTWEPMPAPSGSSSYFPSKPPAQSSYTSAPEPHPTGAPSYEPHPTSAPVYTTAPPAYTTQAPATTSAYVPPVYTGAAVANAANGFGVAAFIAAVVAVL